MKRFNCLLTAVLSAFFVLSCGGDPEPQAPVRPRPAQTAKPSVAPENPRQESAGVSEQPQPAAEVFDPASITKEEYDAAKAEVQQLIQKLNGIIRARNYTSWVSYLGEDYFKLISSREYLDQIKATYNLALNDVREYFNKVVVPSRTNDRVDDIKYISQNRVIVYTISQKGDRLRLYDLEKTDEGWKIIN
jgi:hypothetical protein